MMNAELPFGQKLRRDVTLITHENWTYILSSDIRLRVRPAELQDTDDDSAPEGNASPDPLMNWLDSTGLLANDPEDPVENHPTYRNVLRSRRPKVYLWGASSLAHDLREALENLNVISSPINPASEDLRSYDLLIGPIGKLAHDFGEWTQRHQAGDISFLTYLITPSSLLLARLPAGSAACPDCLVARLRSNFPSAEIADAPLNALFGAAIDRRWPIYSAAIGLITAAAIEMCVSSGSTAEEDGGVLVEFTLPQTEITKHSILPFPGCVSHYAIPVSQSLLPVQVDVASSPATSLPESWRKMQRVISPLVGIVHRVEMSDANEIANGFVYAATFGSSDTTRFSPVRAPSIGGAVKSSSLHARVAAVGESIERYACGVYDPQVLIRGTYDDLKPEAVEPDSLPLGSRKEYENSRRVAPWDPDLSLEWAQGISLATGARRLVPACAVYVPYRFRSKRERLLRPISTGLACGSTLTEAALSSLYEVVERDSFAIFWENMLVLPTVNLSTSESRTIRDAVAEMERDEVEVTCKLTTTDLNVTSVVMMAIQWREGSPMVCFSARSNFDFEKCVLGALEELQLCRRFVGDWIDDHGVAEDPRSMRWMGEFYSYYCHPERVAMLDFVKDGPRLEMSSLPRADGINPAEALEKLVSYVSGQGYEPILVNITPVDVAYCGLTVTRAIVPGLRPVTFARDFRHLGGRRLYDAPIQMGVRTYALTEEELNPNPMPGG